MWHYIGKFLFLTWGWKIQGDIPYDLPKKLYVVIPHTSNWDFPVGIMLKLYKKMEVGFVGKQSLFNWPVGWLFRKMGGIPVNRTSAKGFIESVADAINKQERFSMSIAPEGTRMKVNRLKSGYFRLAKMTNIPIVYTKFDWEHKTVVFDKPRTVAETWKEEEAFAREYFKGVLGAKPEYSFGYEERS